MRAKRESLLEKKKARKPHLPRDKIEFFERILGIKPYPYQSEFPRDPSPLKVMRWFRRSGKTTIMSGDDIHFAAHNPDMTIIVTMPRAKEGSTGTWQT